MNRKIFIILLFSMFNFNILAIEIYPKNIFIDHYELIPSLGRINSIATSINKIFAISDNYLLMFDKNNLELIRTTFFGQDIFLVAYDQFYEELWISSTDAIFRYNINLGSVREYKFYDVVNDIGVTPDKIYILSRGKYSLDRLSGKIEQIAKFPDNVRWYRAFDRKSLEDYKFLSPYFYQDNLNETNDPFYRYEITSFYDEGMYLYVGTDQYGILKYNKISLERQRVVYGPLSTHNIRLKKIDGIYYFISSMGISSLQKNQAQSWQYFRLMNEPGDFLYVNNEFLVSHGNNLTKISGAVSVPIAQFRNAILSLSSDETNIYVGTNDGMYRILRETSEPIDFGPDKYPVYVVYPTAEQVFVGGEFATYRFDRAGGKWYKVFPRGTKDICEVARSFYFLTTDNQLIQYSPSYDSVINENDTVPIILPYFNIYDIDSDGEMIYCATGSGINYFDPKTQLYNPVYNLPLIGFNYVAVVDEYIVAISDQNIYRLAIKFRD
ncbi:MAG: hypothetical protein ABIL22_09345 [candidate division WOR-3 bacterium]